MDNVIKNNIIKAFPELSDLFQAVVDDFVQRANTALAAKDFFTVVLSGGNTAKYFFDALAESELSIPWRQIKIFFGDERYVSANDEESNYYMAKKHLFSKLPIPTENIYRIPTEFSVPKIAAEHYEMTLRKVFSLKNNEFPKFDLVYLGLGENAHTASLMPFSDIVEDYIEGKNTDKIVASLWVPELNMYRITLTPDAINHATCVCFMVTGSSKASAVWHTLNGPFNPQEYPAQLIQCVHEKTIWYLDQTAVKLLRVYIHRT
ncbi:MAG: 6-phosphogluconolactonase [Gammaproteobacteria bacterium]|nr:6-phosphogluconolactonase [Gammaproteobacteria bacterium]